MRAVSYPIQVIVTRLRRCVRWRLNGAVCSEAAAGGDTAAHAGRVHEAIGAVADRDAGFGVAPGDLAAGAAVAEGARRARAPEAAQVRVAVVAGDDDR